MRTTIIVAYPELGFQSTVMNILLLPYSWACGLGVCGDNVICITVMSKRRFIRSITHTQSFANLDASIGV